MGNYIKEKKIYFIIIGIILLLIGGIWFHHNENKKSMLIIDDNKKMEDANKEHWEENNLQETEQTQETNKIMVHIIGQVKNPGVVEMNEGARLIDAIKELGGATAEADLEYVNLAQKLRDEEKIYIPRKGEIPKEEIINAISTNSGSKNSDIININTASLEQLKTLSGIGDVLASNIIEYRETNGGFKNKEELMNVKRIGEKIYNSIKDKIKI